MCYLVTKFSCVLTIATVIKLFSLVINSISFTDALRYMSGHNNMAIKPSRWSWNRFKDLVHFYFFLGAIPATAVILYINLFIGPARLAEIPEGYTPEPYEYHAVSKAITCHLLHCTLSDAILFF